MPFKGGFIGGQKFQLEDVENTEYQYVIAWGKVCRDARVIHYQKKNRQHNSRTDILLKYGHGCYITLWAYGDTPASRILAKAKHKDTMLVIGTKVRRWRYRKKDGLKIQTVYIDPALAITSPAAEATEGLARSLRFMDLVQDEFLSAQDYEQEFPEPDEDDIDGEFK